MPPMNDSLLTHDLAINHALDHIDREWLITNGTGAYAMGTVPGVNTRRYHGLFVAARRPPVARVLALNQVLEQVIVADEKLEFTTCEFKGGAGENVFVPAGYAMLRRFRRGASVSWRFEGLAAGAAAGVTLEKDLHLHWKQQAATIFYRVTLPGGAKSAKLRLSPMLTLRDFHAVLRSGSASPSVIGQHADAITLRQGEVVVTLRAAGSKFVPSGSGSASMR
jgi:predicted glycogen debranching enzyme